MKSILPMWNRLKWALGAMPTRPATGRRTAPGHPVAVAVRWAGVIAPWVALCSMILGPIVILLIVLN